MTRNQLRKLAGLPIKEETDASQQTVEFSLPAGTPNGSPLYVTVYPDGSVSIAHGPGEGIVLYPDQITRLLAELSKLHATSAIGAPSVR